MVSTANKSRRSATERPSRKKRLFALSIDETVEWAALTVTPNGATFIPHEGQEEWGGRFPWPDKVENFPLQDWLKQQFKNLQRDNPDAFSLPDAIGVSSLGTIRNDIVEDSSVTPSRKVTTRHLQSIRRKKWAEKTERSIINFNELLQDFFPRFDFNSRYFRVDNDATAKAWAESGMTQDPDHPKYPFAYITVDEGMNCGILVRHAALESVLHPELGHAHPPIHPSDRFVDTRHSGCARHVDCYEALASDGRIKKRWGVPGAALPPDHEQWEILAHYIAHACITVTAVAAPRVIVVGGCLSSEALLDRVREKFVEINPHYISYEHMRNINEYIKMAAISSSKVPLLGALHVASSCLRDNVVHTVFS